jgi:hypothetical protein
MPQPSRDASIRLAIEPTPVFQVPGASRSGRPPRKRPPVVIISDEADFKLGSEGLTINLDTGGSGPTPIAQGGP